ncbi:unnamed protein product, partial [Vitis vinifera]|uniref:Uncharacterized protein n=1 Tax=Vitis vinifera TaxID=29760 RepID=D7U243_VITVI
MRPLLWHSDERLQDVLGHYQKDFEGGVSAENLGAKFGGYGSFLPTYQRSPLMWSHQRTPQKVQIQNISKPSNLPSKVFFHKILPFFFLLVLLQE